MSQLCAFRCQSISKDASIISLKPLSAPLQGIQYKGPWSKQTLTLPITHDDDETVYRQFPDVHCSCWRLQAHWVGLPVPISRITPLPSLRIRFSILAANCMPDWDLRRHNWTMQALIQVVSCPTWSHIFLFYLFSLFASLQTVSEHQNRAFERKKCLIAYATVVLLLRYRTSRQIHWGFGQYSAIYPAKI